MKYLKCKKQGFTLIEVMVVIATIAILAVVAYPAYYDYIEKFDGSRPFALTSTVIVDGVERNLTVGSVVIGNPVSIKIDEEKTVHVILDTKKEISELFMLLPNEYKKHGDKVKVSNRMQATLDSQYFNINSITPEIQAVGNTAPVKWLWSIKPKPKSEGTSKLTFTLSVLITLQGQSTSKVLETYTRDIFINVPITTKAWTFLQDNGGWLSATITTVSAFIGFIFYRLKTST